MTDYAFPPATRVSLPIKGRSEQFPVAQLFCVGRNYADHAIEMGHDPNREPPFFFMKPNWAVAPEGGEIAYPAFTADLHHELELVVALGKGGQNVPVDAANDLIFGYALGIDLTRRDLQGEAKEKGRPWEAGKTFLNAAPCSAITPVSETGIIEEGSITLTVNGDVRQDGNLNQMIWKIPEVISRLSELFILQPGDLIFTGTPAGVSAVVAGDRLSGKVAGIASLDVTLT